MSTGDGFCTHYLLSQAVLNNWRLNLHYSPLVTRICSCLLAVSILLCLTLRIQTYFVYVLILETSCCQSTKHQILANLDFQRSGAQNQLPGAMGEALRRESQNEMDGWGSEWLGCVAWWPRTLGCVLLLILPRP